MSLEREASAREREEAVDWIGRMARGDDTALQSLYARYNRVLFGILMKSLNDRGEAEEAMQDLFTKAWTKAESYDPDRASPYTWLCVMARSIAIDRLRKRHRRPGHEELEEQVRPVPSGEPSAGEIADARDDGRELRNFLDCLSPFQRKCIFLAYFKGFSHAEIAAELNRPLGSVKSDIRRGLLRLRSMIRKRDDSSTT